jgi:hypothetical protein
MNKTKKYNKQKNPERIYKEKFLSSVTLSLVDCYIVSTEKIHRAWTLYLTIRDKI